MKQFFKRYGWSLLWIVIILTTAFSTIYALVGAIQGYQYNKILAWCGLIVLGQHFLKGLLNEVERMLNIKIKLLMIENSKIAGESCKGS